MKRAAVISIGTNSTRALVAELDDSPRVLFARSIGTRLGEGLGDAGALDERAADRTLAAVREHAHAVREFTTDITGIATSALRRACDAQHFLARARAAACTAFEVISGEEEARRSFAGAVSGIAQSETTFGVLDCGGGSTEYAIGTRGRAMRIVSCEIGAVRLTQAVPILAGDRGMIRDQDVSAARRIAQRRLAGLAEFPRMERLVCVGGSATTAVSVLRGVREPFEYASLDLSEIAGLRRRLQMADLQTRTTMPGMNPQRADILLAGVVILECALALTAHEQALISTFDLLMGTLLQASS